MGEYTERLMNYKSLGLNDIVREILQTAIALVAPQTRRNAMKDVKNGANTIFIPGYLNAPRSIESFEREYGEKVAYLARKDIGELRKLVLEAAKHGKYVKVIGFSDGGKVIEDYINTYGDIEVDAFIAVASNPVKTSSRKVVHVVGDRDILAPLESEYDYHHMDHLKVFGTHTDFIFNPTTQAQLGAVVRNSDFRRYSAVKGTYLAGIQAKRAA
jgi:pimeloyl-ACP methyl ester carboxylesterase